MTAFFLKNWDETDERGYCSSDTDFDDARYISEKLELPLKQINYVKVSRRVIIFVLFINIPRPVKT